MTVIETPLWYWRLMFILKFKVWMLDRKERVVSIWKDMLHWINMFRPEYQQAWAEKEYKRVSASALPAERSWEEITDPNLKPVKAKRRRGAR